MRCTFWSEEETQNLIQWWPIMSAREIGERMGRGRNSIIGMAHRLKLKSKVAGVSREPELVAPKHAPKRRIRSRVSLPPLPPAPPEPWPENGVPLLEATRNQCRAVLGSSDDSRHLAVFCGRPIQEGGRYSFCSEHIKKYTNRS